MTLLPLDVRLFCRDPVVLAEFYQRLLGLAEQPEARSATSRALRLGEAELGFNKTDSGALLGRHDRLPGEDGITAFATFEVTEPGEVEVLATRVTDLGGRVIKGPYVTWYQALQVVAADPEGNVFRLDHPQ
jgi:predicted enzyme related to lactoylglutathione lyase